ncbi:hypothetical protein [Chryseobacterium sp. CFS15]|uniref:hypothetical protein n=1 Tax=Chryseobacterium sp. CFS15 TaxID=2986946 RepID=UPI00280A1A68|nr:hypothetical protein [Chryseobacterium sp. CFS15]MDQ8141493.1 hypothetical protein [Chryseobacterium sp. CFS15]
MDKGKKIGYSVPLKYYWDELYRKTKKLYPKFSNDNIFALLRYNILNSASTVDQDIQSKDLIVSGLELWREDSKGELLHIFFLEKYLQDFLESTPLSDLDGIRKYLYDNGEKREIIYTKVKTKANCVNYSFGLHIPNEKNGFAFALSLFDDNTLELYFSHGINNGRLSDKFYADLNKKQDVQSITLSKMFRLAVNTIAYMKCFPECITDGVPKISYPRGEDRSDKNVIFKISENICDLNEAQISKTPHFRKGYFRLLKSDYYTHKKGQLIYVTETMVKGKAKTVAKSDNLEKFN